ncbi:MAG: TatD family deoxyribonuclease, partial [Acidiferrobacteraceae bacterium]|nr:TatD family deoxyribonuclease [Acidiferrobacteraceae bacterium]
VGVGESGLDYYRSSSGLDMQRERFRSHLRAANACRLPIIVHTRNAKKDTMSVIAGVGGANAGGVMHCFTEDWEMARHALDYGFYISFSGIVTFKNAHELKDVAKKVPADRLLIETDAPYLSPAPNRGKRNEPAYIAQTAKYIATLKNIAVEDLIGSTCENFFSLFSRATKLDSQNDFGRVLSEL